VTTLTVTINGRSYGPTEVRDELTMNDYLREYLGLSVARPAGEKARAARRS
jgi:aerobic-type carbon monoxide dehydrogenase small subunit (CoxS/CutS family)